MYRKFYTNIKETQVNEKVPYSREWKIFDKVDNNLYILYRYKGKGVVYTPMYIHSISFVMGNDYKDCEKYNLSVIDPYEMKNINDKIRYFRLKKCLYQKEVAESIGIDRTTYVIYENGVNVYPLDIISKLSDMYGVDLDVLLDDYHRFIYNNQGENLRKIRKELNLQQWELSEILGVGVDAVKRAEQEKTRFQKKNYIKLMDYYNQHIPVR